MLVLYFFFFFSSRRRHTRLQGEWSSDVCSSDLVGARVQALYTVTQRVAGRQHEHRDVEAEPPRRPDDVDTRHLRHAPIDDRGRVTVDAQQMDGVTTGRSRVHHIPVLAQPT